MHACTACTFHRVAITRQIVQSANPFLPDARRLYSRDDDNATAVPLSNGPRKILRETRARVVASSAELRSDILCKNVRAFASTCITCSAKLIEKQACVRPHALSPFRRNQRRSVSMLTKTSYRLPRSSCEMSCQICCVGNSKQLKSRTYSDARYY